MPMAVTREPWRARLTIPNYQVQEAARYARVSPQTVRYWHRVGSQNQTLLVPRESGEALSYMELIEVAVVSALRKLGLTLKRIKDARDYVSNTFKKEYPFAAYDFKTDGLSVLLDYQQVDRKKGKGKLLNATQKGQLEWEEIVGGLLKEFEYERALGLALKWHVAGLDKPIIIDPRISFGSPNVKGVPTWILKGRWEAGESIDEIAEDFYLSKDYVTEALVFEGVQENEMGRKNAWIN
jgi:uncharacterized protein (DUF433 family)/DNA-binding transcriptional MerR regulator